MRGRVSIRSIVATSFVVLIREAPVMVAAFFVVALGSVVLIVVLLTPRLSLDLSSPGDLALAVDLAVVVFPILWCLLAGTMTAWTISRIRGTRSTRRILDRGKGHLGSIVGALLLVILVQVALSFVFLMGIVSIPKSGIEAVLIGMAVVLFVPLAVFIDVSFSLAVPTIVMEDQSALSSLRRSWQVVRGHRWPLFVAYFLLYALAALVYVVGPVVAILLSRSLILSAVVRLVGLAIAGSFGVIVPAVAYDQMIGERRTKALVPSFEGPIGFQPPTSFSGLSDSKSNPSSLSVPGSLPCPECKVPNNRQNRFCHECGKELPHPPFD